MISWLKERGLRLIRLEKNSTKLAFGCSLGIYIAFSPFVGLHTAMVFLCSWLFGLNIAVLLTVSMMINNPWTMVPVYGAGYWFGDWFLAGIGINHHAYNPQWVITCNTWLQQYIQCEGFSFWAFMLGGNVLGIALALLCYPLLLWLIRTSIDRKEQVLRTMVQSQQAVRSLKEKAAPMIQKVKQKSRFPSTFSELRRTHQRTVYETSNPK